MSIMDPIIIVGTGIAGYTLAREFRKLDSERALVLISADDGRSYPKPILSNALTKGKIADDIAMFDADAMSKKLNAEILTHTKVTGINSAAHSVTLSTGEIFNYKRLVLALGASPIHLAVEGNAEDELLPINDLADYALFRDKLEGAKHVAIIGPGLIGCEFANDLLNVGIKASIIGSSNLPMSNLLPDQLAQELADKLEKLGVEWHLSTTTKSINKTEKGYHLVLENSTEIEADIVISAIGLRSNITLAKDAGLNVNRGIITDNYLQTSAEDIYALGDCAEVSGLNLLFIAPIMTAAKSLAQTLAENDTEVNYPAMPVAVKTPCYPLVIASPAHNAKGQWEIEAGESGFGQRALFIADNDELLGFVLSGDLISEKRSLAIRLADLL